MKKQRPPAIGTANNPYSQVIPAGKPKRPPAPAAKASPLKVRATFHLTVAVLERARAAAVACRLTLSDLAEEALAREVARLERTENAGAPFPPLKAPMRTGRPIGK